MTMEPYGDTPMSYPDNYSGPVEYIPYPKAYPNEPGFFQRINPATLLLLIIIAGAVLLAGILFYWSQTKAPSWCHQGNLQENQQKYCSGYPY